MSNINDGGAAFPVSWDVANSEILNCMGMSLRDYFAAKAMQGAMVDVVGPNYSYIAEISYEMADAMIRAREAT